MAARKPLTSRPLDLLYFVFFLIHIPNTLLIDLQAIYPPQLVPSFMKALPKLYVDNFNDPLIGGAMGYFGPEAQMNLLWLRMFMLLEAFFQLPIFIVGAYCLWRGSRAIYIPLILYGASTATTTLPCLAVLYAIPTTSPESIAAGVRSLTTSQKMTLLSSYVPFCIIPLLMAVDMGMRVNGIIKSQIRAPVKKIN